MAQGKEFIDLIDNIAPLEDFDYKKHIVDSDSINADVEKFYSGKIKKGFKIGIECFDEHFVCKERSLYALTGKKGKGKTTINKVIQLMQSIVNDLIWVCAFQENSDWGNKIEYLQYLLGDYASDVRRTDPNYYNIASKWIDDHYIFLDVENIKQAIQVVECLLKDGVNVHALLLDPVNSFEFGYKDSGNTFQDGVFSSKKVLRWCKKNVSVYASQHPTIRAQREKESVSPFDAEYGFWNNKAHVLWTINRTEGNENHIGVHSIREKLTGGIPTDEEQPLIIEWFPTKINILKGPHKHENVIQFLLTKHNPLNMAEGFYTKQEKIPTLDFDEAFGEDPF